MVVTAIVLLLALSIVMERLSPSSSQAVVQAYVVRMAPEVALANAATLLGAVTNLPAAFTRRTILQKPVAPEVLQSFASDMPRAAGDGLGDPCPFRRSLRQVIGRRID